MTRQEKSQRTNSTITSMILNNSLLRCQSKAERDTKKSFNAEDEEEEKSYVKGMLLLITN